MMKAYGVLLNGKEIDRVYYDPSISKDEIRRSLINHDRYNPGIKIIERRSKSSKKLETAEELKVEAARFTVGDLRRKLKGLPDGMPVYYQRIEDVYFRKRGWKTRRLLWEPPNVYADYISVWDAYAHHLGKVFVLDAHY
jgi:hypothetical protein